MDQPETPAVETDERVPVSGTWPRMYAAVLVSAVLVMLLIAAFSRWNF